MKERAYPVYTVNKHAEGLLVGGHPWVYENDILHAPDTEPDNGALALGFLESAALDAPSPAHRAVLFTAPSIAQITTAEHRRIRPLPPHDTPP